MYKGSRFTFAFESEAQFCLYHSLSNRFAIGNELRGVWEAALRDQLLPSFDIPNHLVNAGFFVQSGSHADFQALTLLQEEVVNNLTNYRDIWLFLTEKCNGSCEYCRQRIGRIRGRRSISLELIEEFWTWLDINSGLDQGFAISLFGGEPSLVKNLLKIIQHSRNMIQAKGGDINEINVFSNGRSLSEEFIQCVINHGMKLVLSLDGTEWVHDQARGKGSFSSVRMSMQRLREADLQFGLSLAVGNHNATFLPQIAEFVANEIDPVNICFIPLHHTDGADPALYPSYGYVGRKMLEAYEKTAGSGLCIENIDRKVDAVVKGAFILSSCGATSGRITLFPDGTVSPCQSSFIADDLREGISKANLVDQCFTQWQNRLPVFNETCLQCPCLALCGGGCGLDSHQDGRGIHSMAAKDCSNSWTFLDWIIGKVLNCSSTDICHLLDETDLAPLRLGPFQNQGLPFDGVAGKNKIRRSQLKRIVCKAYGS